jgi:hypothetical protein
MPILRLYEISFDLGTSYNGIVDWQHHTWKAQGSSEQAAKERILTWLNRDPHSQHQVANLQIRRIGTTSYHEPKA